MFDIGGQELLLILIVVLMLFGPKKLPELMQSFGKGVREFRRAQQQFNDHINTAFREEEHRQRAEQSSPPPATIARPGSNPYRRDEPAAALPEGVPEGEEQPKAEVVESASAAITDAISESAPFAPSQLPETSQNATPTNGTTVIPKLPVE